MILLTCVFWPPQYNVAECILVLAIHPVKKSFSATTTVLTETWTLCVTETPQESINSIFNGWSSTITAESSLAGLSWALVFERDNSITTTW